MLFQLMLAGSLDGIAGLAIGRFSRMRHLRTERPLIRVLLEVAAELDVPLVRNLGFGHVADNWTLPLGTRARLDADAGTLELLEPAVE